MKVSKLLIALISVGVSFQNLGARTINDLAASAVLVAGILRFPLLALLVRFIEVRVDVPWFF